MTLPMLRAVIKGYENYMFDLQCNAVMQGYWSGYYMGAKHPKAPTVVLQNMLQERKRQNKHKPQSINMDAAVAKFQEREERLRRYLDGKESKN